MRLLATTLLALLSGCVAAPAAQHEVPDPLPSSALHGDDPGSDLLEDYSTWPFPNGVTDLGASFWILFGAGEVDVPEGASAASR